VSHITKVKVDIKDLDALGEACKELGGELHLGVTSYREYYSKKKCNHCIRFTEAQYEIGVIEQADGTFSLEADFYSTGGLVGKVGKNAENLAQQYKGAVVKKEMKRKGFKVVKSWQEADGRIQMEFERNRTY
jgi:hypothetical protein